MTASKLQGLIIIKRLALTCCPLARLLDWATGITADSAAHQRTAAAQGLQLAIRLGLSNGLMLNVLLDPKAGEGFFVAYQNPVQAWVLFNNEASCKVLGPAVASSDQSRVAEVVLSGTLQMLEQYKAGNNGRHDPRQRWVQSDLCVR